MTGAVPLHVVWGVRRDFVCTGAASLSATLATMEKQQLPRKIMYWMFQKHAAILYKGFGPLQRNCLYFQPRWFQVTVISIHPLCLFWLQMGCTSDIVPKFVSYITGSGCIQLVPTLGLVRWVPLWWQDPAGAIRPMPLLFLAFSPEGYHQIHVSGLGNSLRWPHIQVSVLLEERSSILSTC